MPGGYVTTDNIDLNELWYGCNGILAALDTYKAVTEPLIGGLAMKWPIRNFRYAISATNGFEPLAQMVRPTMKYVATASMTPVYRKYGYGAGYDEDTLRMSTGREVMLAMGRAFLEDPEFVYTTMIRQLMVAPGTLNSGFGFYNGQFSADEVITNPPRHRQNTFAASHTHYMTTGATLLDDLDPISEMKETIRHHGNKGPLVAFINSQEQRILEELATFTTTGIIRSPISDMVAVSGFDDTFQLLGVRFVVTEMMPAGYILMVEAPNNESERVLLMFEPDGLGGLQLHPGDNPHYPMVEAYWTRWMGFKVWNRGGGAVMQVTANASYTSPTFV